MLIQFLVRDEPSLGGWQSGLFTAAGAAKPRYHAFALPLAEISRQRLARRALGPGAARVGRARLRAAACGRRRWRTVGGAGAHGAERRLQPRPSRCRAARAFGSSRRRRLGEPAAHALVDETSTRGHALRIVHLLAAIVWSGGTIALVFVAVPPVQRLQGEARAQTAARVRRAAGARSAGRRSASRSSPAPSSRRARTPSTRRRPASTWCSRSRACSSASSSRARTCTTTSSGPGSRARSARAGRSRCGRAHRHRAREPASDDRDPRCSAAAGVSASFSQDRARAEQARRRCRTTSTSPRSSRFAVRGRRRAPPAAPPACSSRPPSASSSSLAASSPAPRSPAGRSSSARAT